MGAVWGHWRGLPQADGDYALRMQLYNYYRSSASYRVRIALALKGLPYDYVAVHLGQGEHRQEAFRQQSPDMLVPVLHTDAGHTLVQSMAIIEYLDELHPKPPLLPPDALGRAQVRALAQSIACEIHPLNNLRVLQHLTGACGWSESQKTAWYHHWLRQGLESYERQLLALDAQRRAQGLPVTHFCWGVGPTLADCLLVPQIFNAQRFAVSLQDLPRTMAAYAACAALPAVEQAHPAHCPDFTP